MIGRILGNRYHLIELIGEGGMALVYKAECSLLCRTVAVKVLRPQYASDADLVERFRREARAAASLSHPNVVNIYDVGQEDGIDYIVMEYIPGENLKDLIKREAPLAIKRALEITSQIAEALHHAHQRNIVHRDIKPHNILMAADGQIKVTDFGIARALSVSSLTQAGMVVGSVQYISPEQAHGEEVGPQSDLYSLGCVLYELLTGSVPFKGDTPIAIAMQHLEEKFVPVRQIRPDITPAVERILYKALAKELTARYPSAAALLKDIRLAKSQGSQDAEPPGETEALTQIWQVETPAAASADTSEQRPWWWLATIFGGSFLVVAILTMLLLPILIKPRPEVAVPSLVGKDLVVVRTILKKNNLRLKLVKRIYNTDYPPDTVISQKPRAGQKKRAGSSIEVVASRGPELVRVPILVGKTEREAILALEEVGLQLGEVLAGSSQEYPEGTVIRQLPKENTQIEMGASVSITVNGVSNQVQVPNFIGKPLSEVRAELGALGLAFNRANPAPSSIYEVGVISDQKPVPYDRVPRGTAMTFIISSGPPVSGNR